MRHYTVPRSVLVLTWAFFLTLLTQVMRGETAFVQMLTSEDHLIENLTVVAYLVGALIALVALWQGQFRTFAALWFLLCVVFAGEETSWFQRLVGYNVPTVEKMNSQSEFNLHNLNILHGSDARAFRGPDGTVQFGWRKFLTSQTLFRAGFLVYFFLLPLLLMLSKFRSIAASIKLPPFDTSVLISMWAMIALTAPLTIFIESDRRLAVAECRELIYALTIAFYVSGLLVLRQQSNTREARYVSTRQARIPVSAKQSVQA